MADNFNKALNDALEKEFAWLDNFENPYKEYSFSKRFEKKMKKIFYMPERTYVSIGSRRIRKKLIVILIALLVLAIAGYAIATTGYELIKWNETPNDSQKTLDITFDVDPDEIDMSKAHFVKPKTPEGFTITYEKQYDLDYDIYYSNSNEEVIYYSQEIDIETMGLSIDNEDNNLTEITINGYKGYSFEKDGMITLIWTDGVCLYTLRGTCDKEILEEMTKDIVL